MLIDVTNTLHQPYTTGIQRLVRELARHGSARGADLVEFSVTTGGWHRVEARQLLVMQHRARRRALAFWSRRAYRNAIKVPLVARAASATIASQHEAYEKARRVLGGQEVGLGSPVGLEGSVLVLPEITSSRRHASTLANRRASGDVRLAVFLHDVLPATHPEWFPADPRHHFAEYLSLVAVADRVAVASSHVAGEATRLVPAGTVVERFPLPAVQASTRLVPADPPVFLMLGSIEPRKNHVRALAAATRMAEAGCPIAMVIIGQTGWGSSRVRAAIDVARRAGVRVDVFRSATDDEVLAWLGSVTALVYPSLAEGYGLPVVEALAAGTPVITSNRPALDEFAGVGGVLLVDPEDEGAIERAMRSLADPDEWRRAVGSVRPDQVPVGWGPWSDELLDWAAEA